jgi:hypothetical protein
VQRFTENKKEAEAMAGKTQKKNHAETAALVTVTNAVLNLDEVLTKY